MATVETACGFLAALKAFYQELAAESTFEGVAVDIFAACGTTLHALYARV